MYPAQAMTAVRLSGDLSGEAWLREWLTEERDINAGRAMLLLPSARPPGGRALRGRIVCSCFNVSENEIEKKSKSPKSAVLPPAAGGA